MDVLENKVHVSPTGEWETPELRAYAWVSGDNRAKTWTYWWIRFETSGISTAEYEVFQDGVVVVQRTPLVKSPKVFAKTGYVDDEPDERGLEPIGGAAKLDAGIYAVDFYLTFHGQKHVLRGVRFEVADRKAKNGGWQIKTPIENETSKG